MKKLILALLVTLSLNAKSQDTTYMVKRNAVYMKVVSVSPVNDSSSLAQYKIKEEKRRKRLRKQSLISLGLFVIGSIIMFK